MRIAVGIGIAAAVVGAVVVGRQAWNDASATSCDAASRHAVASPTAAASEPVAPRRAPRVVLDRTEYDFGVFEVGQKGRHTFTVRNAGDADLALRLGSTTCKCTLAELKLATVPPGGSTEITLDWEAEHSQAHFRQGVRIKTNDPQRSEFGLGILGKVRSRMDIDPTAVYFCDIPRNAETQLVVTLYSQAFDDVRLTKLESTDPRLKIESLPHDAPVPEEWEARFARRLVLTYAAGEHPGPFHGTVRVYYEAQAPGVAARSPFEFHFTGEAVGDVSLQGRSVVGRVLNLGTVSGALGTVEKAYVHVRNPPPGFACTPVGCSPEFLQVRVLPVQKLSATMIRLPVEVTIPRGAAPVVLAEATMGEVRLQTTHPELPEIKFRVAAVVGP